MPVCKWIDDSVSGLMLVCQAINVNVSSNQCQCVNRSVPLRQSGPGRVTQCVNVYPQRRKKANMQYTHTHKEHPPKPCTAECQQINATVSTPLCQWIRIMTRCVSVSIPKEGQSNHAIHRHTQTRTLSKTPYC